MRYSLGPQQGMFMTLDDLTAFVAEMKGYRELPGDTPVRALGWMEIDLVDGPRITRLTADPDTTQAPGPNRAQRRARGGRGPRNS